MADRESRPGPSRRDKGKAKVGEPIELSYDEDQKEKTLIGQAPSDIDDDDDDDDDDEEGELCISKTLTSSAVDPLNPVLYIDAYEAYLVTDMLEFLDPPSKRTYSKTLAVFDNETRMYDMVLSYCVKGDWAGYSITRGWGKFVLLNNLKAGDEVSFYRKINTEVLDCYYYDIKYVRKDPIMKPGPVSSDDGIPEENVSVVNVPSDRSTYRVTYHIPPHPKNVEPGPGFRHLPKEAMCFSMILTQLEVSEQHPKLYLSPDDVFLLTDRCVILSPKLHLSPGRFSEDLPVFDEFNRRYAMNVSNRESGSPTRFLLNTGWNRYVRTFNLKQGDEIMFFRFSDKSVCPEPYYYVLRFIRKPRDKKRPTDDEGTSGRKQKDALGPGSRNVDP
ncbi:hypothetical protein OROMI_011021 [Orobanche minor]